MTSDRGAVCSGARAAGPADAVKRKDGHSGGSGIREG